MKIFEFFQNLFRKPEMKRDTKPPIGPTGLTSTDIGVTNAGMKWNAASDNIGVVAYNPYKNGVLYSKVTGTLVTVYGHTPGTHDSAGNLSLNYSNEVTVINEALPVPEPVPDPPPAPVGGDLFLKFQFTIPVAKIVSASVYRGDTLIRNLFENKKYDAGTHIETWQPLDDTLNPIIDTTGLHVKVLDSNVTFQWEGAIIGNTGDQFTGPGKYHAGDITKTVCFVGDESYWGISYNEGWPAQWVASVTNPHAGKKWFEPLRQTNQCTEHSCTDGKVIYWAGFDPIQSGSAWESFVFGTYAGTKRRVPFSAGVPVSMEWGSVYANAISVMSTRRKTNTTPATDLPVTTISGMAVQKSGQYLFVSRKALDQIQVLNKTTGALVQTLTIPGASRMCIDQADNLWVAFNGIVSKYKVNADGTLANSGLNLSVIEVGAMDVSPDNKTIAICDMDAQIVRAFDTISGNPVWKLGTPGGYFINETVTNTKFLWKNFNGYTWAFIKYLPNGSFYLGDPENRRTLIFDAARNYVDAIMWLVSNYQVMVDKNNNKRVINDLLEFEIDYSKPLAPRNGSWKLKKNWSATYDRKHWTGYSIFNIVTLPNGRTYGYTRFFNDNYLCELVEGKGVKYSLTPTLGQFPFIDTDGALYKKAWIKNNSGVDYWTIDKFALIGFDANNVPVWSSIAERVSYYDHPNPMPVSQTIIGNKIVVFDIGAGNANINNTDFHLGARIQGSNEDLWRIARGTSRKYTGPFPTDSAFDNGNTVNTGWNGGGGMVVSDGDTIAYNYHGEFWKQTQTNKWNFIHMSGLMIGQFGNVTLDFVHGKEAEFGSEGNALTGALVKVGNDFYLYHNGESNGLHRWKISNLDTINIRQVPVSLVNIPADKNVIDLMKGIERYVPLRNNEIWSRSSDENTSNPANSFSVITGFKTYDIFKTPDIQMLFRKLSGTDSVTATFNAETLTSWKLTGEILLDNHSPNEAHQWAGTYIDLIDTAGKIIVRTYLTRDAIGSHSLIANGVSIKTWLTDEDNLRRFQMYWRELTMKYSGGVLDFKFGDYTNNNLSVWEVGANKAAPGKLKFVFFTNVAGASLDRKITVKDLKFYRN